MTHVRIQEGSTIEDPREYGRLDIENLGRLLQTGAPAQRDPRRQHFYQIDGQEETYYIHVSPVNGNVVLLAKWLRDPQPCCAHSSCAVA